MTLDDIAHLTVEQTKELATTCLIMLTFEEQIIVLKDVFGKDMRAEVAMRLEED